MAILRFSAGLAHGSGSRRRSSSSRWRRPTNRAYSSSSTRSHAWSCSPRKCGSTTLPWMLHGSSASGSKPCPPPTGQPDLGGLATHQLVHQGALSLERPQQAPYALHVLALAECTAHDDRDISGGYVDSLVQYPCRYEGPERSLAESREHLFALPSTDVAGERHDQVLAGDAVGVLVVGRENQQSRVTMTVEQHTEHLALGLREGYELACAAEGIERTPPFDGPCRRPREVLPARAGCHAPELRMHLTERRHPAFVRLPLGSRQVEMQGDDVEAGEEGTRKVADRELVGGRANEFDQPRRDRGIARRGRRESQPGGCDRHLQGLVAQATAEVVRLVDHEEIEAVAEPVHVPVGTLEGGNGQRGELVGAVAVAADGTCIRALDVMQPLREQDSCRNEAQRARSGACHRCEGQPGFAAPSRQDDDCAALRQLPGPQRRLLVRAQLDRGPGAQRQLRDPDLVRERHGPSSQLAAESPIAVCGRPVGLDAWVPEDPRDSRRVEARIEIAQERRTAVEEEAHGREASNRHAAGAIPIHVAESRCELRGRPSICNEAQHVVARSTVAFATRYGLRPSPATCEGSRPTAPHVPTCSSSSASHGPSSGRWRRRPEGRVVAGVRRNLNSVTATRPCARRSSRSGYFPSTDQVRTWHAPPS